MGPIEKSKHAFVAATVGEVAEKAKSII